jgi:streptogramin lyase
VRAAGRQHRAFVRLKEPVKLATERPRWKDRSASALPRLVALREASSGSGSGSRTEHGCDRRNLCASPASSLAAWLGLAVLLVIVASAAVGCGDQCRDEDKDGRGEGCSRGPDCDDHDPRRALHCEKVPASCQDDPTLEGCPCLPDLDDVCYPGAPETLDVGVCHSGHADCAHGVFLECQGAKLPGTEVCNQRDDDCDGTIDEWVASPCGGCNATCSGEIWGQPVVPFAAESDAFAVTPAQELTLARTARERKFVWVPNTDEGTLSKIDADAAVEVARYRTPGGRPIRVAVDHRGDAWVLDNPAGARARLSKFSSAPERCIDRDRDGLQTSASASMVLDRDDCRLLDVTIGELDDDAQALAIDGAQAPDEELAGNAWVGFLRAQRVVAYDGLTGQQLTAAELPKFAAYASSFDPWGVLWLIDRDGQLARVDPLTEPPAVRILQTELACYTLESICADPDGQLMFAGFGCESVARYDPRTDHWSDVRVPDLLSPRGVALTSRAPWVVYTSGRLAEVARDPLSVGEANDLASDGVMPFESVAVAADSGERLWIVSTQGGTQGRGLATRFDPTVGKATAQVSVGVGPRGGGDLTGLALGEEFVREASIDHIFAGSCADAGVGTATRWKALHLVAEVGAGGSVQVEVRWAEDADGLAASGFMTVGSFPEAAAFPLNVPQDGVIEVRLTLRSAQAIGAPRIERVGAEWVCAGPD